MPRKLSKLQLSETRSDRGKEIALYEIQRRMNILVDEFNKLVEELTDDSDGESQG